MSQSWKPRAREVGMCGPLRCRNASNTVRDGCGAGYNGTKSAPKFKIQVWGAVCFIVLVHFFYGDFLVEP